MQNPAVVGAFDYLLLPFMMEYIQRDSNSSCSTNLLPAVQRSLYQIYSYIDPDIINSVQSSL